MAPKTTRPPALTAGQRDYEAKRAAKAGMSLDKWLAAKDRAAQDEARRAAKAAEPPKPAKPPNMLKRLIDRAHQPLKPPPATDKAKPPVTKTPGTKTPATKNPVTKNRRSG